MPWLLSFLDFPNRCNTLILLAYWSAVCHYFLPTISNPTQHSNSFVFWFRIISSIVAS
jgi:hypothetical protein